MAAQHLAIICSKVADWSTAVRLAVVARLADLEVGMFVIDEAVAALASDASSRSTLLALDCSIIACATSALALSLDQATVGVELGSQDDHAALIHRADRVVAFT